MNWPNNFNISWFNWCHMIYKTIYLTKYPIGILLLIISLVKNKVHFKMMKNCSEKSSWRLKALYLLRRGWLHVALWGRWSLHDRLWWRRWWRWWVRVSSGRLVARRRWHGLTRGSHDVTGLRWGVLGEHCWRSLIHWGRLRVLTGSLPTQCHLGELRSQLFCLGGMKITSSGADWEMYCFARSQRTNWRWITSIEHLVKTLAKLKATALKLSMAEWNNNWFCYVN